jgi:acetoin utilization deacetylase AcuC-like enzyme
VVPGRADHGERGPGFPLNHRLRRSRRAGRRVEGLAVKGGGWFDPDTYCTEDSYVVALNAAACASRAAEAVMQGEARSAFAVIRPPGHHATVNLPMGFCLFNNAAIAVRAAQSAGAARVAIIDIDVHHGNGTQDIFYADPTVLYSSLHQFPWYPGTGHASDRGDPGASGTTVNVPVPPGTGGARWLELFDSVVLPEVATFDPDFVVVSAGFDAHRDDPLAELRLEDETYSAIAHRVRTVAEAHCEGRSLWLLEGGYDLRAIAASVAGCLRVLAA